MRESSADMCRRLGWVAGTRLTGYLGDGRPITLEITAVGLRLVLCSNPDLAGSEFLSDLTLGKWTKVTPPPVTIPDETLWGESTP